mmetsp:Transcript_29263/g.59856  ORF Transcript_29263/g.59856 Transcript_29263/m.59856 type:complete len:116 (+) Transcript_29263:1049-1396(+)
MMTSKPARIAKACIARLCVTCHRKKSTIKPNIPPTNIEANILPQNIDPSKIVTSSAPNRCLPKFGSRKVGITPDLSCNVVDITDGMYTIVREIAANVAKQVPTANGATTMYRSSG